jgi:hypothetical protein
MTNPPPPVQVVDTRANIIAWAKWSVANKAHFTYSEGNNRMTALGHYPPVFPQTSDCSAFVTWLYWISGALDPNGGSAYTATNYGRQGYTGTLLTHGTHISANTAVPGDVVVYGAYPGQHTALIVQAQGLDILTVSHGGPTGQSPIYCWVNKPTHLPQNGYPVDGREPQTFLRFDTTAKYLVHTAPL